MDFYGFVGLPTRAEGPRGGVAHRACRQANGIQATATHRLLNGFHQAVFSENALHGGTFNVSYKTNSYTEVSALVHYVNRMGPGAVLAAGSTAFMLSRPSSKL